VTDASTIDYGPLTGPAPAANVIAFRNGARMSRQPWAVATFTAGTVVSIVVLVLVAIMFGFIALTILLSLIAGVMAGQLGFGALVIPLLFCALFLAGVIWAARRAYRAAVPSLATWTRWYRLSNFADANHLEFSPVTPDPTYPGAIFGHGDTRQVYDHLYRNDGRFLDLGNYRYSTGSGRNRTTHHWGFVAMRLDRRLPNMVLDAKSNNTLFGTTDLPLSFSADQKLSLEGDFDNYFTLYCPNKYEEDALYVFTPDLMALLIDQTAEFDVEIVDDWLFLYSTTPLNLSDVPTLNHLFRIIDTVGATAVSQTERYSDNRVATPGLTGTTMNAIAPEGRRLKTRWPVIGTIVGVLIFSYWMGSFVYGLFF
jgi:uncharacterized membrane protein YfbV (UPF0208 family)